MLSIEEYIARRKKEDRLNEFDVDVRMENMRICTNYIFEYFTDYINIAEAEERTALHNEKLDRYRKKLHEYEPETREWLVGIYAEYDRQMNLSVANILKQSEFFLIYNSDSEFRSASYDCYSQLIKKCPFMKEQTEMLFVFIKEYHQIKSQRSRRQEIPYISDEINEWIEETWTKHQVDVAGFVYNWIYAFWDNEDRWPVAHRLKCRDSFRKYDYDIKQKSNLFGIDQLYKKIPKKQFLRGRKQELEILMMYYWLHNLEGDDENYWQDYIRRSLPSG